MIKELFSATRGWIHWNCLKHKYNVDDSTVVIILPEKTEDWNASAIQFLPYYMKRKNVDRAVVLFTEGAKKSIVDMAIDDSKIEFHLIKMDCAYSLANYYCLHRFYDMIVFFFLDYPKDNRSNYIIKTTEVTSDELVCYAFYHLREVPVHV